MSANQIISSIIQSPGLTNDDLNRIIEAVKFRRSSLGKDIKQSIKVGSNVEFTSSKTGRSMRGLVKKIAIKYVTVDTGLGLWKVPANMLNVIDTELA